MIPKISAFIQNYSLKIESNTAKPRYQIISDRCWLWLYKHFIKGLYTCDIKILDEEIYKNISLIEFKPISTASWKILTIFEYIYYFRTGKFLDQNIMDIHEI